MKKCLTISSLMHNEAPMRIFVTGATGFIGRHLCEHLVQNGHTVVALVRNPQKTALLPVKNVEILNGNLASFKNLDFVIPACDAVIHLAGVVTAKRPVQYFRTNFDSVVHLFHCLERQPWQPKRFIFLSSIAAAGPSSENHALSESDDAHPVDDYGRAKRMAEDFLLEQNKIPVTVLRPSIVIGPYDTNVLNLYKVAKLGMGFVPRARNQRLSFVSVQDLVQAIALVLDDTSLRHRTYFVTHNLSTTSADLWKEVGRTLNKKVSLIKVPQSLLFLTMKINSLLGRLGKECVFDKKYYDQLSAEAWTCSADLIGTDFGWKATESLSASFDKTTESYKQLGWI